MRNSLFTHFFFSKWEIHFLTIFMEFSFSVQVGITKRKHCRSVYLDKVVVGRPQDRVLKYWKRFKYWELTGLSYWIALTVRVCTVHISADNFDGGGALGLKKSIDCFRLYLLSIIWNNFISASGISVKKSFSASFKSLSLS